MTPRNLSSYEIPLMGFDGMVVKLARQIRLLVVVGGNEVLMDFIVVHAYSSYTAILARPWLHAMCALPSSLHLKVKFLMEQGVGEIREYVALLPKPKRARFQRTQQDYLCNYSNNSPELGIHPRHRQRQWINVKVLRTYVSMRIQINISKMVNKYKCHIL